MQWEYECPPRGSLIFLTNFFQNLMQTHNPPAYYKALSSNQASHIPVNTKNVIPHHTGRAYTEDFN